jgi:acyl carrier protein
MSNACAVRTSLREWVIQHGKCPGEIGDDTRLIERRIISSLQVIDLILFIERLSNRRIEVDELSAGAFASIDTIFATFFKDEARS